MSTRYTGFILVFSRSSYNECHLYIDRAAQSSATERTRLTDAARTAVSVADGLLAGGCAPAGAVAVGARGHLETRALEAARGSVRPAALCTAAVPHRPNALLLRTPIVRAQTR